MSEPAELNLAVNLEEAVERLLSLEEEEALEEALAEASPVVAARAVAVAADLERKTELLWAMEDRQRREVLDRVPPALIGALVQNLEEDNRYLLGDVSFEQYRGLLALCSPERKYYWLNTALSFTDVRANALPLLMPTRELTEILLTRAEFEAHIRLIGDFPIEHQRIPGDLMLDPAQTIVDLFGPENMLREFPLKDDGLAKFVQHLLDHDPDRYVDIIREALRQLDYSENHPLEFGALVEDPILLSEINRPEPLEAADWEALPPDSQPEIEPLALLPVGAPPLARVLATLPAGQRERLASELQQAYVRQAIAEGGSFLLPDLRRVARSVEAYLLLGLRAESGGRPELETAVLERRPLNKVLQSGARILEALRQVALRVQPLARVLDPAARAVVESVVRPRLTVSPAGEPLLRLLPAPGIPEEGDLETVAGLLRRVAVWTDLARALGLDRTEAALKEAGTVQKLQEELALGAVLFARVEPGLTEPADGRRFLARYQDGETGLRSEAETGLRRAVEALAAGGGLDAAAVGDLLLEALRRISD
jgi:hypothetical protein